MKDSSSASAVPGAARIAHLETELKQAKVKISAMFKLFKFELLQVFCVLYCCILCVFWNYKKLLTEFYNLKFQAVVSGCSPLCF